MERRRVQKGIRKNFVTRKTREERMMKRTGVRGVEDKGNWKGQKDQKEDKGTRK